MTIQSIEEARWNGIPESSMREILRQAETYLECSLRIAIAADQRATTLMGIYGAVGVALLVAAATLGTGATPNLLLIIPIIVMACFLLFAGLLCGLAAMPNDFNVSGYEPEKIIDSSSEEPWLIRYVCEDLQRRIDGNKRLLIKSSHFIFVSFVIAGVSVAAAVLAFFILRITSLS